MKKPRLEKLIPLITLPLILAVCVSLWVVMNNASYVTVESENGVWDLRSFDFSVQSARLRGSVEYIPEALLTPKELEARAGELTIGDPSPLFRYSTSRITILLPEGETYMLTGRSIDFASYTWVNGKLASEAGIPGESAQEMTPDTAEYMFMDEPIDGRIVIVQQTSNFVHRAANGHDDVCIGYPGVLGASYRSDITAIFLGCYLALFFVHFTLFFILRSYRANLYFSLFCLVWFLRTGVTGAKLFSSMLPSLSWYMKFRMEYLALPLTAILLILVLKELFPGVLPRWFRLSGLVVFTVFTAIFLFAGTVLMSWAMLGCYACIAVGILGIICLFCLRLRKPSLAQGVVLVGAALFFYAAVRDMFFYNNILLPPRLDGSITSIAMLNLVFFLMTAMFMGTVHAAEQAKAMEQKLIADNAALNRLSHMKSDLLATVAHETRTPLAVLSGYAELISMEMKRKGVDLQTARDLDQIADETQRIATILEEMQNLSKEKDSTLHRAWIQVSGIIEASGRLYAPILEREKTALALRLPDELPPVFANAGELTQVMFNLLQNAKNHTKGGAVTISAFTEGESITVCVADTGSGIAKELLPDIFKRDVSGDQNGSGLGLAICKEIIDAHGGEIGIKSELGSGTTVTFTIPVTKEGGRGDEPKNDFIG